MIKNLKGFKAELMILSIMVPPLSACLRSSFIIYGRFSEERLEVDLSRNNIFRGIVAGLFFL
jgi:hypothetical protein